MKHFLKVLYLGLFNIIYAIECALSFYLGIKLIIRIHNTTGFAAIGMFLGGNCIDLWWYITSIYNRLYI